MAEQLMTRTIILLSFLLAQGSGMKLDLFPTVVQQGGAVRWRCEVPRDPENRGLRGGFAYRTFGETMDGAAAPRVYQRIFSDVPCDPGNAFCEVKKSDDRVIRITAQVVVSCGEL